MNDSAGPTRGTVPATSCSTSCSSSSTPPSATVDDGERGAILVEFALVALFLVTLALGVFEIGMIWSDHQVLTQASRSGARVASQLGTAPEADRETLRAIEAGFGGVTATIDRIVVFEADANGAMPAACETASAGYSGPANCNVYDATDIAALGTDSAWGAGTSCGTADDNWCPVTDRDDAQATASYVGVRIEIDRSYLTQLFGGGTHAMTETTVMRIEPNV
ncbi:MAG: TadE/TadG family type IV pilus assembly protein [Acidimicrobiales bacterium]